MQKLALFLSVCRFTESLFIALAESLLPIVNNSVNKFIKPFQKIWVVRKICWDESNRPRHNLRHRLRWRNMNSIWLVSKLAPSFRVIGRKIQKTEEQFFSEDHNTDGTLTKMSLSEKIIDFCQENKINYLTKFDDFRIDFEVSLRLCSSKLDLFYVRIKLIFVSTENN